MAAANGSVLLAFLKGCFHGIAAMLLRLASADSSLATAEVFELFLEVLVFRLHEKSYSVWFVSSLTYWAKHAGFVSRIPNGIIEDFHCHLNKFQC